MRSNFLLFSTLLLISGCNLGDTSAERFRISVLPDGRAVRLDTKTGGVALIATDGLVELKQKEVQLVIGKYYSLENGELVQYLGKRKFGDDMNALIKKYSSQPK